MLPLFFACRYQGIVEAFANDTGAFANAFEHTWYKLATRDMGPVTRCVGPNIPPAQPWQFPLPPPKAGAKAVDFARVREMIKTTLGGNSNSNSNSNSRPGDAHAHDWDRVVGLAWRCASTFRQSDYQGGCNGARIRHSPEKDWAVNAGYSDYALALLEPIYAAFPGLSWSDLIVLAGSAGLEASGSGPIVFCGGRVDALDGAGSANLDGTTWVHDAFEVEGGAFLKSVALFKQRVANLGLSNRHMVALVGGGLAKTLGGRSGFAGAAAKAADAAGVSNNYFKTLFGEEWQRGDMSGTRRGPFTSTPVAVNSISPGSPYVCPTGVRRTCGEPDEIKKNPHPELITALGRDYS